MKRLARPLALTGILFTLFGLLFMGQGLGLVRWPETSFMIGAREWVEYGAAIAVAGLLMVLIARRAQRRR